MISPSKDGADQMQPQRCLIMFAKYPAPGKVKTRLSRHCHEELTVLLYRAFIADLLARFAQGDYQFRFAYDPPDRGEDFRREFGEGLIYLPQAGSDLGGKDIGALGACRGFRRLSRSAAQLISPGDYRRSLWGPRSMAPALGPGRHGAIIS